METKRFETIHQEKRKMKDKPTINTKSKQYKTKTKPLIPELKNRKQQ